MRPDSQRMAGPACHWRHLMQMKTWENGDGALRPVCGDDMRARHNFQIAAIIASGPGKLRDQRQFSFLCHWAITDVGMPCKMTAIRGIVAGNLWALGKFSEIKVEPVSV